MWETLLLDLEKILLKMGDKKVPVRLEGAEGTDFTNIFVAVFVIILTLGKEEINIETLCQINLFILQFLLHFIEERKLQEMLFF